jgi:hypothetical protein
VFRLQLWLRLLKSFGSGSNVTFVITCLHSFLRDCVTSLELAESGIIFLRKDYHLIHLLDPIQYVL